MTPIIKAKFKNKEICFYTLSEYDEWNKNSQNNKYSIKYYKGLGTSTSQEAKGYFENFESQVIRNFFDEKNGRTLHFL